MTIKILINLTDLDPPQIDHLIILLVSPVFLVAKATQAFTAICNSVGK